MMAQSCAESTIYIQLWKIDQSIPAEYNKINTAIRKDQQENI